MKSAKFLGFIVICLGLGAMALTNLANWHFGAQLAKDFLTPSINVIIDWGAFLGFPVVCILWMQKKYWQAIPALAFASIFLMISAANVIGYMASGRIAVADANAKNTANEFKTSVNANDLKKTAVEGLIKAAADKKTFRNRSENMIDQINKIVSAPVEKKSSVKPEEVVGEAQAKVFAWFTKADLTTVQIVLSTVIAIVLVLLKPWASFYGTMLLIGSARTSKKITRVADKEKLVEMTREEMEKAVEDAMGEQVDKWLIKRTVKISTPNLKASEAYKLFQAETGSNMTENRFYRLMRQRLEPDHISRVQGKGMHYHIAIYEGPVLVKEQSAVAS